MEIRLLTFILLMMIPVLSCQPLAGPAGAAGIKGSFGYDRAFIRAHDPGAIVLGEGSAQIIVSPKYQAKVLTSTTEGDTGLSFGWIHYKAFEGPVDPHMNAYGGENRLWLGPEGGRFSLFFQKDAKMEFANWKTPAVFDTEPWQLAAHTSSAVTLHKDMALVNYAGTSLSLNIDRMIMLLSPQAIDSLLGLPADASVAAVGYQTDNKLTNTGGTAWDDQTGMPCIWMLDMFPPSDRTTIVMPYVKDSADTKPATTDYFGEIPADRIRMDGQTLFFKADGKSRGKLGIHPGRAKNIAGSYDALHHVLTLIIFDVQGSALYLNQEWNKTKPPFSGDAVNAYNDGPLAGGGQLGPFYELESVSPAAFLKPGQSLTHRHSVFHFTGDEGALDRIAQETLKVSLDQIKSALK